MMKYRRDDNTTDEKPIEKIDVENNKVFFKDHDGKEFSRTRLEPYNPLYIEPTGDPRKDKEKQEYGKVSQPFTEMLYDFIDDDWEYFMRDFPNPQISMYKEITFRKEFPIDMPEGLFNKISAMSSQVKLRFENEGFKCGVFIFFNGVPQNDHNPSTNKADIFTYHGYDDKRTIKAKVRLVII